ncbi:MAG: CBS domain-containing protein [Chthoniobacterales bacterium]|nr:CBS domain-containing protein [Chthoniobacterales bacterium]
MTTPRFAELCISPPATIRDAIECINRSGAISLALLVNEEGRLVSVITDGDIRRGILHRLTLDAPVGDLLPIKSLMPNADAVTAPVGSDRVALLQIMEEKGVRQLPLLNEDGKIVDIVLRRDLLPEVAGNLQAVIMAGGFGKRLWPLTESLPKPMLPVGGRPLMERIVRQLQQAGIHRLNITTHYKPEKIVEHFGTGSAFGVDINYVNEDLPLGTAGALRLMPRPEHPFLVVNGDVLTGIDYAQMLDYHREHNADMTVAVNLHTIKVPYGVVDSDGSRITGLREKPEIKLFVNAGIYLLNPSVYEHIPAEHHFDMTDLIHSLIEAGRPVVSFPIREYWMDIGQHHDYAQAQADVAKEGAQS